MKRLTILLILFVITANVYAQDASKNLGISDILALKQIQEIQQSPDEQWIAYVLSSKDTVKDKANNQIWMVSTEGGEPIPMTAKGYSASSPRWSPDGKYLSFLAKKKGKGKTQVWIFNRLGGESQQLTKTKQGVSSYEWSPQGNRLLLVLQDAKPADLTKDSKDDEKLLPHVIDRIYFKKDYTGYLDRRRNHIYVFTPGDSVATQITSGDYDDSKPKWSPDGKTIVFVSNRSSNPDLNFDSNIWTVSADNKDKGAKLKQITTKPNADDSPDWSDDGKYICYTTIVNAEAVPFSTTHLAIIPAGGGQNKVLTMAIDRNVMNPTFSKQDTNTILFTIEDSGERQLVSIGKDGELFKRVVKGSLTVKDFKAGKGAIYTLHSDAKTSADIYKLQGTKLKRLTQINKALLANVNLPSFEKVKYSSEDSTAIEGFVLKPRDFDAKKKYPLILWIHGGPTSQFTFDFERTTPYFLASNGYVVLLVNPRGSTGYGEDFCKAIFADWGNKDYQDVMAGVDHLIDQGFIDENRLGVGGWSYGGILTNYIITKNTRFKAAISGASLGLYRSNFGHDQYVNWYNAEFKLPWENKELWEKLSPFNDIEKIITPTLWMGGAIDWNVPIMNSEQMYLGMKILGRETQLVVYPKEHHGIRRPSFQKDRLERYINWFDNYLK
jgi:dipeptidyl aminopeptidase/acylaminoacyl peptidase